ncbi:MAG TPA: sigma-54 dependent transcriptional regulator [Candidatus Methylomirabilis sp.]|nr:sigma-54 dependent transcriptional regulator [Candidatus Methylomirabilis sp.]
MDASILVVDDTPATKEILNRSLAVEGYRVATAGSGEEALSRLEEEKFDVIVTDIVMPGVGGLEVLERSRLLDPRVAVILMTGYATLETAIAALRRGACDYLEKPFALDELKQRLERLIQRREKPGWEPAREEPPASPSPPTARALIGESAAMRAVREQIARCAYTPSTVLITGESGTGKELVARAIHAASPRRDHRFIPVNCGAIPEALLESQLFGHLRGAFTTAVTANPGLFAAANRGTLFLDEIVDLPLALQVKLLRVIEDRHAWPVGGVKPVPVDVRIIASSNRDLAGEVAAGRFRGDLFYRLNVVRLDLPPLRERRGDIPLLVEHLVDRLNTKLGAHVLGIERDALRALIGQPWKGNVRELENVLERAVVLGRGDLISLCDLPAGLAGSDESLARDLRGAVRRFERKHLMDVLAESGLDKREAAQRLGISLASLYRKLNLAGEDGPAPIQPD